MYFTSQIFMINQTYWPITNMLHNSYLPVQFYYNTGTYLLNLAHQCIVKSTFYRRHIVVVKVKRNKTVLSVFINVNPNGLLTIKVAKYEPISLYILSQTYIATRLGSDFLYS